MNNLIIEIMDTCDEAIKYIDSLIKKNNITEAIEILVTLRELIYKVLNHLKANNIITNYSEKYCNNIIYSIDKIILQSKNIKRYFYFEVSPLIKELKKSINFELNIINNNELLNIYSQKREDGIKAYAISKDNREYIYKVSIIVTAYNKLEYTKKAIDSIYKNTDFKNGEIELITINNGSNDETESYFESLPNTKKINLKYNILGNESYKHIIEGKYFVGFSNDVVATPRWLENLIKCIESDEKIFWVVPTCNEDGISNAQGVKIDYENSLNSIEKIYEFGDKYNFSNRLLWEERNILMPFIWLGRSKIFEYFDLVDKSYLQHEFVDDDLSTSLRRLGLKQILAKDTFMHHFGSITLRDERKNGSLENMREVYYKKWGVDAWDSRGYAHNIETMIDCPNIGKLSLLFIEPKFGGNTLMIKNHFKKQNIKINDMTAIVCDERYLPDAKYMYDQVIFSDNLNKTLKLQKQKYNLITFGVFIHELYISDTIKFLESLYDILEEKGQVIFVVNNYRNTKSILNLLQNNIDNLCEYNNVKFTGINFEALKKRLNNSEKLQNYKIHSLLSFNPYTEALLSIDDNYENLPEDNKKNLTTEFSIECYIVAIYKK